MTVIAGVFGSRSCDDDHSTYVLTVSAGENEGDGDTHRRALSYTAEVNY
jgi:hypothetical protein